ncbi:MFS transporter [Rhodospirillum rubrum]|uniref:BCD family MFS transporter n=1 Tax=Rhodospirillum rubrum TaxID=1085 RepID=UPI001905799F|nr:BCD family MFS transporter [Rhodospirillum rubrum]MBK1665992.1 MFS transporter [Rhodospirillum rubrum]MBK1677970.1 MFS transporter [Rhodospirillum rubrum]
MRGLNASLARRWLSVAPRFLPFADAATKELPLGRLLRLSLFQVTVGMAGVLLTGTLNRVMIVELGVPTWLVAVMVALPILFAPFRVLIGFRSDTHRSVLGWRRVPYIWMGTLLQFGGFAVMPFALFVLAGDTAAPLPPVVGELCAGVAFLLVGAGIHTTQTAGLALATDLAPEASRPRVVALLYVMLLIGMTVSSFGLGALLEDFSPLRLIQVVQGAAALTLVLNLVALWKQEARQPALTRPDASRPSFSQRWGAFATQGRPARLLCVVGLGTAGFTMQDILLEPYGGEILHLSVGATTMLTAMMAMGTLVGFALAARALGRGAEPHRLAAYGLLAGIAAFCAVIFSGPLGSPVLFRAGSLLIGFGSGLFSVGTLTAAMALADETVSGMALGAWGAVQATATGAAVALGGGLRDGVSSLAAHGLLGEALTTAHTGYGFVYLVEVVLLFTTLAIIGPLVRTAGHRASQSSEGRFGLAEFPG